MIYCIELHAVKEDIFECTFISVYSIHQTAMLLLYIEKKLDERELNCLWRTLEIDLLKTLLNGGEFGFLWVLKTCRHFFFSFVRKCLK